MWLSIKKYHWICFFAMAALFSGCIRLTGGAGYWHKGPEDEQPKVKQVGFDTNDYVPGAPAPGNITRENS